jgi:hypothetical protein
MNAIYYATTFGVNKGWIGCGFEDLQMQQISEALIHPENYRKKEFAKVDYMINDGIIVEWGDCWINHLCIKIDAGSQPTETELPNPPINQNLQKEQYNDFKREFVKEYLWWFISTFCSQSDLEHSRKVLYFVVNWHEKIPQTKAENLVKNLLEVLIQCKEKKEEIRSSDALREYLKAALSDIEVQQLPEFINTEKIQMRFQF